MVPNKVIVHNKIIFSYFDISYQNQIIYLHFPGDGYTHPNGPFRPKDVKYVFGLFL